MRYALVNVALYFVNAANMNVAVIEISLSLKGEEARRENQLCVCSFEECFGLQCSSLLLHSVFVFPCPESIDLEIIEGKVVFTD